MAGFFNNFVNPIGLKNAGWKFYIRFVFPRSHVSPYQIFLTVLDSYIIFLAFEVVFIWFMFPETLGRSLEELTFREYILVIGRLSTYILS